MSGQVKVSEDSVLIQRVSISDASVVDFFSDVAESQRAEVLCRAVGIGVAGLRAMTARTDVDQVERGFEQLKQEFQRAFDPDRKTSYLGQLAGTVDAYFGEDGVMAAAVAENGQQVEKAILEQMVHLRDAVVGKLAAAEEREKGTAKGIDFEDEVESALCRLAKAYGDTVVNVSTEAGDAGNSRCGDFVVELAEGPRFTVEAKNKTSAITLRGGNGILPVLCESMENRQADFAIAVSKVAEALPKEVGVFNEYDGDKVVCAYGPDGSMLEVAYRWARARLLADLAEEETDVDVEAVRSALAEALDSVNSLAKTKAKATAIIKTAREIQEIVEWHATKARSALSQAEQALEVDPELEEKAS